MIECRELFDYSVDRPGETLDQLSCRAAVAWRGLNAVHIPPYVWFHYVRRGYLSNRHLSQVAIDMNFELL